MVFKISVLYMRACLRVCPAFQHVDRFADLRVDKTESMNFVPLVNMPIFVFLCLEMLCGKRPCKTCSP
jgi:hypothetical protein